MATLQAAPTRHNQTEQFSGIHQPILTWALHQVKMEEGMGKTKVQIKMACEQQAIAKALYEELQASNCVYKSQSAPARGIGPLPVYIAGKTTDQHCLKVNC